jgi:hypothetical protein
MLLHQATLAANWSNLSRYAREGCPDFIPVADEELYEHSCEALARFAAPSVVERLDLGRRAPVLLLGWGGAGYGEAVDRRWPGLEFATRNPFIGDPAWAEEERAFGTIILSGLLASSDRGEVQLMLENSVARLADGGFLVLHDAFVPAGALPPPEVVLGSLGRRMYRGGCRTWSIGRLREALEKLRLRQIHVQQMPAATTLVTAERP